MQGNDDRFLDLGKSKSIYTSYLHTWDILDIPATSLWIVANNPIHHLLLLTLTDNAQLFVDCCAADTTWIVCRSQNIPN